MGIISEVAESAGYANGMDDAIDIVNTVLEQFRDELYDPTPIPDLPAADWYLIKVRDALGALKAIHG